MIDKDAENSNKDENMHNDQKRCRMNIKHRVLKEKTVNLLEIICYLRKQQILFLSNLNMIRIQKRNITGNGM